MKTYTVKVTETYVYNVEVEANSGKEAVQKVKNGYRNNEVEYDTLFVADTCTFDNVKFKLESN